MKKYVFLEIPTDVDESTVRLIIVDALTDYINARTPAQDYVSKRYPQFEGYHAERKITQTLTRIDVARKLIEGEKLFSE